MSYPDYTLADTADGTLLIILLHKEIQEDSIITTNLAGINRSGDNFTLVFDGVPSAPEQAQCDVIVGAHKDLSAVQDLCITAIKIHRDEKRLVQDIFFEHPAASGNIFSCAAASQDNWDKLATLDAQGSVTYPYTVTTYDERSSYDLVDTTDRQAATAAIAAAVEGERALAATAIANVLAAVTDAAAIAAAEAYLLT